MSNFKINLLGVLIAISMTASAHAGYNCEDGNLEDCAVNVQSQYYPGGCEPGYYLNASGVCVHKPTYEPGPGATALCADGKFSYATRGPDICANQHGGVVQWVR